MDWQPNGARAVGDKNEAGADDKIGKVGEKIHSPVSWADGKDAPFGQDDKGQTNYPTTSNNCDGDGADTK